jgi:hypothetical protein
MTIIILGIIHRPAFDLKQEVSETGFGLRLQVVSIQMGQTERATLCPRTRICQSTWFLILSIARNSKVLGDTTFRKLYLFLSLGEEMETLCWSL